MKKLFLVLLLAAGTFFLQSSGAAHADHLVDGAVYDHSQTVTVKLNGVESDDVRLKYDEPLVMSWTSRNFRACYIEGQSLNNGDIYGTTQYSVGIKNQYSYYNNFSSLPNESLAMVEYIPERKFHLTCAGYGAAFTKTITVISEPPNAQYLFDTIAAIKVGPLESEIGTDFYMNSDMKSFTNPVESGDKLMSIGGYDAASVQYQKAIDTFFRIRFPNEKLWAAHDYSFTNIGMKSGGYLYWPVAHMLAYSEYMKATSI